MLRTALDGIVVAVEAARPTLRAGDVLGRVLVAVHQALYLFGGSKSWNPLLGLVGVAIARRSSLCKTTTPQPSSDSLSPASRAAGVLGGAALLGAVLGLRLLDHVIRLDDAPGDAAAMTSVHVPYPPPLQCGRIQPLSDKSLCPLCARVRRDPCVSTGGFVFCYACICEVVDRNPICPISQLHCKRSDLIRVFGE
jgi:hypothetical protein